MPDRSGGAWPSSSGKARVMFYIEGCELAAIHVEPAERVRI